MSNERSAEARRIRATSAAPRKDLATSTWWFVIDLPADADGRRRQAKRRGFTTKKAAQEELDRIRGQLMTNTYVAPKRQTLGEYLTADWLPAVRRELAPSTWESYERNIRLHVTPRIGGVQLQKVDGPLLDRLCADLLDSGRKLGKQSPGLKPRTVRYIHSILSGALDYAVRQQRIVFNPAARSTPPSAAAAKAPEMRTWTAEQVRRFLSLCEGDRYYWSFAFLVLSGCRRGEALGLRWADVDLDRRLASIRQSVIPLTKSGGKGREARILPRTKTDKSRTIELDASTVTILRRWCQHRPKADPVPPGEN